MEQRRFTLFVLLSSLIIFGWFLFLGPMLFPQFRPGAGPNQPGDVAGQEQQDPPGEQLEDPEEAPAVDVDPDQPQGDDPEPEVVEPFVLEEFPHRDIVLGSMDRESGYFLEVEVNSQGASIETITLNDERYIKEAVRGAPREQLRIVGNDPFAEQRTLDTAVNRIDALLRQNQTSLSDVDWEVDQDFIDAHTDADTGIVRGVRFRYPSPDGKLEVFKTFEVQQSVAGQRDEDASGYLIRFSLQIVNLTEVPLAVGYELTGPVGVPLENVGNRGALIQVKTGLTEDPAAPMEVTDTDKRTAAAVVKDVEEGTTEPWRASLRYIGVDVQFFAALLVPTEDQQADPYFDAVTPFVVFQHPRKKEWSDVSVLMTSTELTIGPNGGPNNDVVHEFRLFAGPKRSELLEPIGAEGVIEYGWFGSISVGMVYLLQFFHEFLRLPYGLAIVFLTLIVRACMFPITRKQAKSAKKMKELQPEMARLKEKYGKEPEKFWAAQKELWRKHNYRPLAGCLPLFLQMPIFFGLYSALNVAVDLRMVSFLWIDNLAAPDALFQLPFTVPWLEWTEFNLLPLVTISLWIVQQKLFMPAAASEEQAMQQKMMTYMMLFFGFMIYTVPAGLCVYFITSTVWGVTERKLLDFAKSDDEKQPEPFSAEPKPSADKDDGPAAEPKKPGFFQRLQEAADQARDPTNGQRQAQPNRDRDGGGRKKGGGGKRKKSRR